MWSASIGKQPVSIQPLAFCTQQIWTLTPEKLGERLPDEVDADEEHEEKEDEDGTLMVLHDSQHRIHPQVRYEGYPQNPAHM